MSALVDRIAEVLLQHRELRWSDNTYSCSCEWDASEGLKRGTSDEHFAHVAERIEAELPRPDVDAVAEAMWLSEREGPWDRANNDQQKRYRELATAALGVSAWSAVPQEDT